MLRKICVYDIDPADNCYCAIVMGWHDIEKTWYNTGIVVREEDPVLAFSIALTRANEVEKF